MAHGSKTAVYSAIVANTLVMSAKFVAFFLSGSGAMLSEAIHSFADLGNQCLLAVGIKRSERPADVDHPYGYTREQFVWALIAGVGIFFLGCGVTVYHGVELLLHPHQLESAGVAIAVLLVSLVLESISGAIAIMSIRKTAGKAGFWHHVLHGSDPMGVAVLLEDGAALLGILTALFGLGLATITGSVVWDAVATIVVGLLLGFVAVFIIYKNRDMLVGRSLPLEQRQAILGVLASEQVVELVQDTKSIVLGPGRARFKAEVDFNGRVLADAILARRDVAAMYAGLTSPASLQAFLETWSEEVVQELARQVDRIEQRIQEAVPDAAHVDLEVDDPNTREP